MRSCVEAGLDGQKIGGDNKRSGIGPLTEKAGNQYRPPHRITKRRVRTKGNDE